MPRESISMSQAEVLDFLKQQRWMVLITLGPDGSPSAEIAPSALDGETLYFGVPVSSDASDNICRDPRVCCANDQYPTYYEIKGATAHGRARGVDDAELRQRIGLARDGLNVYALSLDDVMSFDFGKIQKKL